MEFNQKIKARRLQLGMTTDEVAKIVGVNNATISRWETGEIKNQRRDKLDKLAEALKVPVNWLMCKFADDDDEAFLDEIQGKLRPMETVREDVDALNVLLCEIGEHIIKVDGKYFLGECGQLSEDDIDFIKSSAASGVRMAFETLKKRAEKQMRDAISKE